MPRPSHRSRSAAADAHVRLLHPGQKAVIDRRPCIALARRRLLLRHLGVEADVRAAVHQPRRRATPARSSTSSDADGTPYELADGGSTIMVPAGPGLRPAAADERRGPARPSRSTGYSLLDKQGITPASSAAGRLPAGAGGRAGQDDQVDRRRRGRHRAPGHPGEGRLRRRPAASRPPRCWSRPTPASTLTDEQVQAIVHLVASSVEGLDPTQVTVADADGKVLSAGGGAAGGAGGDPRDQQTVDYEDALTTSLQRMLDQRRRPRPRRRQVTADLDFDQHRDQDRRRTSPTRGAAAVARAPAETYTGSGGTAPAACSARTTSRCPAAPASRHRPATQNDHRPRTTRSTWSPRPASPPRARCASSTSPSCSTARPPATVDQAQRRRAGRLRRRPRRRPAATPIAVSAHAVRHHRRRGGQEGARRRRRRPSSGRSRSSLIKTGAHRPRRARPADLPGLSPVAASARSASS